MGLETDIVSIDLNMYLNMQVAHKRDVQEHASRT